MINRPFLVLAHLLVFMLPLPVSAADSPPPLRIGVVASLSGVAGSYGTAVLEGARLAADELRQNGTPIELVAEDDESDTKNAVTAYRKLAAADKVQALIGGTWWANPMVKLAEKDRIPLLSCETLYNDETVRGETYFIMHGYLADWVRVFEPVVAAKGFKRGAIIRFTSGFATTLTREMQALFSKPGRVYAGTLEYAEFDGRDALGALVQLRPMKPDVIYVDAQPSSFANITAKIRQMGIKEAVIFTHSVARDALTQKLIKPETAGELYFTNRKAYDAAFARRFQERYGKEPYLSADLGYYSVFLIKEALAQPDPVAALKKGLKAGGETFTFDENNVFNGAQQEVWTVKGGELVRWIAG